MEILTMIFYATLGFYLIVVKLHYKAWTLRVKYNNQIDFRLFFDTAMLSILGYCLGIPIVPLVARWNLLFGIIFSICLPLLILFIGTKHLEKLKKEGEIAKEIEELNEVKKMYLKSNQENSGGDGKWKAKKIYFY